MGLACAGSPSVAFTGWVTSPGRSSARRPPAGGLRARAPSCVPHFGWVACVPLLHMQTFLDSKEVTERVLTVVKNFEKVDPAKVRGSLWVGRTDRAPFGVCALPQGPRAGHASRMPRACTCMNFFCMHLLGVGSATGGVGPGLEGWVGRVGGWVGA